MASIGDSKESDPPSKRRNTKTLPSLHELANKRELHHLIPAALSGSDIDARYDFEKTLLHLALESGCSLETLNVFKDAGADIGARDMFGENALVFALRGDCSDEVINELLEYDWGIFFQESSNQKEIFLRLAARKKRLYVFIPVIVKHQKIDDRDSYDWTLLHSALRYDCLRSVETILQFMSPSSLNEADRNGNTYLHYAVLENYGSEKIYALLNAGLNPATKNRFRDDALHFALRRKCPKLVNTILQFMSPSALNETNGDGDTYLHFAVRVCCGSEEICALVNAGVNPATKNKCGDNALHFAMKIDCPKLVKTILQFMSPSSLNETDGDGDTYLHCAVRKFCGSKIILALLNAGLNPATKNSIGDNALHCAIRRKCPKILKTILQFMSPSSLNETNGDGDTYLHFAVRECCLSEEICALLNAGVNPATKNNHGRNALHFAIKRDCPKILKTILQFMSPSSSLNETDEDGNTYLHYAVRKFCGSEGICALVNAGVNPATRNNKGDSALHLLIKFSRDIFSASQLNMILKEFLRGHPEIVEDRDSNDKFFLDSVDLSSNVICTVLKYVLLQNGADFQWNRIMSEPTHSSVSAILRDCRSELELLRAFMVTNTMSLGDLVKACYVSPKFVNELRVEKRFVRVLQFKGILTVYEEEVRDIVRMVRACSSLYGKTLPFAVLKYGAYVNVSHKVLDYLSFDDLEKLAIALNVA